MLHAAGRETQPAQMSGTKIPPHVCLSSLLVGGRTAAQLLVPALGCSPYLSEHMPRSATSPVSKPVWHWCTAALQSTSNGLIFHILHCCYHLTAPSVFILTLSKATHCLAPPIKAAIMEEEEAPWPAAAPGLLAALCSRPQGNAGIPQPPQGWTKGGNGR